MPEPSHLLRPATEADFAFIWKLRCLTMRQAIEESYGWDEQTQQEYAMSSLKGDIILVDEMPAGVLTLSDWGDQIHVVWLALHPDKQGRGIGAALLRYSQKRAAEVGKPLTLQVLRNNPARHLYERCGFTIIDESDPVKLRMRWLAPVSANPPDEDDATT